MTRIPALAFPQVPLNGKGGSATAWHRPALCFMSAVKDTVFTMLLRNRYVAVFVSPRRKQELRAGWSVPGTPTAGGERGVLSLVPRVQGVSTHSCSISEQCLSHDTWASGLSTTSARLFTVCYLIYFTVIE